MPFLACQTPILAFKMPKVRVFYKSLFGILNVNLSYKNDPVWQFKSQICFINLILGNWHLHVYEFDPGHWFCLTKEK